VTISRICGTNSGPMRLSGGYRVRLDSMKV
jgi:hypothetical protein